MAGTEIERTTIDQFNEAYRYARSPVIQAIERSVCDCDYGGTSYTTREEAERIGEALALTPNKTLLEIGAGSGWPSLYLAKVTRCSAVLIDLPFEGLCVASERARSDELSERCLIVQADGASLPLRGESLDGISHSDVLCCLQDKPGVLRECRRTIRGNGRMAFTVIFIRANLSATDFADAVAAGPPFVETEMDYDARLAHTGWRLVSRADLTPMFVTSMRGLADARAGHADQLTDLVGATEYENMVARMREKLPAIERRLLERAMFLAQPV